MPLGPRELALRAQREARFAGKPAVAAPVDTLRAKLSTPVDTKPVDTCRHQACRQAGRSILGRRERALMEQVDRKAYQREFESHTRVQAQ